MIRDTAGGISLQSPQVLANNKSEATSGSSLETIMSVAEGDDANNSGEGIEEQNVERGPALEETQDSNAVIIENVIHTKSNRN